MSKKEFEDRRKVIEFKEEFLEICMKYYYKNKANPDPFVNLTTNKTFIKKIKEMNIDLEIFPKNKIIEWSFVEDEKKKRITAILFYPKNFNEFKSEIEKDKRKLREDELRESQLDFVEAQKEFQKEEKERSNKTLKLTSILALGVLVQLITLFYVGLKTLNNSKMYSLGVVALILSISLFVWYYIIKLFEEVLPEEEKNKYSLWITILFIIATIFMIIPLLLTLTENMNWKEVMLEQPQEIQITNLDQITQNQLEIIKLLNNTQEINLSVTLPEELLEINERLERLEKELKVTK
ncbi:MAG: hypothetical protein ACOCXG_02245 [Nanoarchaeota archaeon]